MATKAEVLAKIKTIEDGVVKLQADLAASGMSGADEAEIDAKLTELSTLANPAVPNPPPFPPDPGDTP